VQNEHWSDGPTEKDFDAKANMFVSEDAMGAFTYPINNFLVTMRPEEAHPNN
jgi:hypothetical protein